MLLRCLAILALLTSSFAFAQLSTSLIQGTITDSSGAPVPNAKVVATLANTDTNYSTVTNQSGNYVIPDVRPGEYSISAEARAFKRAVRTGVVIEVNQYAHIDLTLQVGEVSQSVEVSANATNIDTYTSSINETVDLHRVEDLPLNGRQALQLQILLPGVVLAPEGQAASLIALNTNLTFSINGTRPSASLYLLDGAINMDLYNNTPAAFPNPDALQEFSIQTTNYTAVVGGTPGAAVNMVTKSGSNAYHGELYEFLRNNVLDARNFFAAKNPELRKNQFGANAGGPIRHNKLFFFGAYEGNRQRQPVTSSSNVVPTALERQGNFSQSKLPTGAVTDPLSGLPFPNNIIPSSRLDPVAQKFTSDFLPLPNFGANLFNYTISLPYTDDQFTGRLDENFSDRNHLMLRYLYDDNRYLNNDALLNFNSDYDWATQNVALSHTFTFNATTTNTATFTFNRNTFIRSPLPTGKDENWTALGCISCVVTHPASVPTDWTLSITGGVGIRSSTAFLSYMQNEQFEDSFSKSLGNHLLTMGGALIKARRHGEEYPSGASPNYSFDGSRSGSGNGYADWFLGLPLTLTQGTELLSWTDKIVPSLFFEDDWKVSRKLTLNLGVRWEPYLPLKEQHNRLTAFRPGVQSTLYPNAPRGLLVAGDPGVPDSLINAEWSKISPRVGFAFDPQGNGKMSIRGGYGIFADTPRLVAYNIFPGRQPFSIGTTVSDPYSLTDPYNGHQNVANALLQYAGGVPIGNTSYQFVTPVPTSSVAPGFTNGYAQQWNFNVQRDLIKDFVVTAAYVGTKGTHLEIPEELNGAPYIPGNCSAGQYGLTAAGPCSTSGNINQRRIYQPFSLIETLESNGNSTYHAMQLSLKKRFGAGYSILASYTFSKFIDMTSDDGHGSTSSLATDPFNWFFDRGIADNNRTHRFTASFIWEVPAFRKARGLRKSVLGGWQLNGIVQLQSGVPFSVLAGVNRSLSGGAGDRANLTGSGPVAIYGTVKEYFDTSRFALPALGTFGTAGRNILQGPGYADVDISAFKSFRITEPTSLTLRWEVFNLFNRANFGNPSGAFSSAAFGQITSANDPRIMQVALK
ncbi:MAG TPA: carboxypeptidase-like regulatory domain-containing protein, partial [Bryobacteraceae bacterium]|nr:carboxypeptidase-like regulatory domain-containing protein [Bryobacteraceae bacterium]